MLTFLLTSLLTYTKASGAKFDQVMSTKEQGAFETALVTPASLDSTKPGLSKVDVTQVWTLLCLYLLYPL